MQDGRWIAEVPRSVFGLAVFKHMADEDLAEEFLADLGIVIREDA